jgi:hypothetical protein
MTGRAVFVNVRLGRAGDCLAALAIMVAVAAPVQCQTPLAVSGEGHVLKSPPADDFWRRTPHGWEDIRTWAEGSAAGSGVEWLPAKASAPRPPSAWGQLHPAALALGQWMLSLWGLSQVSHGAQHPRRRGWRAAVAASFRASAFY